MKWGWAVEWTIRGRTLTLYLVPRMWRNWFSVHRSFGWFLGLGPVAISWETIANDN